MAIVHGKGRPAPDANSLCAEARSLEYAGAPSDAAVDIDLDLVKHLGTVSTELQQDEDGGGALTLWPSWVVMGQGWCWCSAAIGPRLAPVAGTDAGEWIGGEPGDDVGDIRRRKVEE